MFNPFDFFSKGLLNFGGNVPPPPQIPNMQAPQFMQPPRLNNLPNPLTGPTGGGAPPITQNAIANNETVQKAAAACGLAPGGMGGMGGGSPMGGGGDSMSQLRKMMLMQSLMGGDEGGGIQGPNGALPSGVGMKGSGGFQHDPAAMGTLNSIPSPLPPRRRFLGQTG